MTLSSYDGALVLFNCSYVHCLVWLSVFLKPHVDILVPAELYSRMGIAAGGMNGPDSRAINLDRAPQTRKICSSSLVPCALYQFSVDLHLDEMVVLYLMR